MRVLCWSIYTYYLIEGGFHPPSPFLNMKNKWFHLREGGRLPLPLPPTSMAVKPCVVRGVCSAVSKTTVEPNIVRIL